MLVLIDRPSGMEALLINNTVVVVYLTKDVSNPCQQALKIVHSLLDSTRLPFPCPECAALLNGSRRNHFEH